MSPEKKILITAIILVCFASIGAAIVGLTFESTKEQISYNEKLTLLKQLNIILPKSDYDNELLQDTITLKPDYLLGTQSDTTAYIARQQNKVVAIVLTAIAPNGYNGPIKLLIGIKHDGTIAGTRVVKHRETPGLGDIIDVKKSDWILGFEHKSLTNPDTKMWKVKRDGGVFDQFTGATITPRAVVKAIRHALQYFEKNKKTLLGIDKSSDNNRDNKLIKKNHDAT